MYYCLLFLLLKITSINLKRMMLSYVSGVQHLQKQINFILLLVKKNDNMKF